MGHVLANFKTLTIERGEEMGVRKRKTTEGIL